MISKDLTDDDIVTLMSTLDTLKAGIFRSDKATTKACGALLIELLLVTGMRGDELVRIKVKDIDFDNSLLHIFDAAKGSLSRSCTLPRALAKSLEVATVRRGLGVSDLIVGVFTDAKVTKTRLDAVRRYWVRLRVRVIGGKAYRPSLHGFRHTAARVVYEDSGQSLIATRDFLGHKSVSSTEHYLKKFDERRLHGIIQTSRLVKRRED